MTQLKTILHSVRNKKFLISNFMNELLDKYDGAIRTGSLTVFNLNDFQSIRLPIFHNDRRFVLETLDEYQRSMEFITIQNGTVSLTSKGIIWAKGPKKDWD